MIQYIFLPKAPKSSVNFFFLLFPKAGYVWELKSVYEFTAGFLFPLLGCNTD